MDTAYLIGLYVPKGVKDGQKISFEPYVPIKVTTLQKEILVATPSKREPFLDEVRKRLWNEEPEMAGRWFPTHAFVIIDPNEAAHEHFVGVIEQLQNGTPANVLLDLTDFAVGLRH